jgi:hypothetical protein
MLVSWDLALVDTYDLSAYYFKKMKHFLWRGVRSEVFLVIYSSWCVGKHAEPEFAFEEEVIRFIEKALELDSFDEHRVIISPEAEEYLRLLEKWEGKVIVAKTPPVELIKPPFKLQDLQVELE